MPWYADLGYFWGIQCSGMGFGRFYRKHSRALVKLGEVSVAAHNRMRRGNHACDILQQTNGIHCPGATRLITAVRDVDTLRTSEEKGLDK